MVDLSRFWDNVAAISVLVRATLAHRVASDAAFAQRLFDAESAPARLRIIKSLMEAESVEVR